MLSNKKQTEIISSARKKKQDVLGDQVLVGRPGDFWMDLKPIKSMQHAVCAISGRAIHPGDYTYRCYESPVRISNSGKARCLVEVARKDLHKYLPQGTFWAPIPVFDELMKTKQVQEAQKIQRRMLEREATKILKEGRPNAA